MAIPNTTDLPGTLHHLHLRDNVSAETRDGRFYALRGRTNQTWTLVDRDGVFATRNHESLAAADQATGQYRQWVAPMVAAELLVAAELRRLADEIGAGCEDYIKYGASGLKRAAAQEALQAAKKLCVRADELDGGAR